MILERKKAPNIAQLGRQYSRQYDSMLQEYDAQQSFEGLSKFSAMMQIYAGAMREISTKLENLDDEFQYRDLANPIHHMESRLKSLESILGKLQRKSLPCASKASKITFVTSQEFESSATILMMCMRLRSSSRSKPM